MLMKACFCTVTLSAEPHRYALFEMKPGKLRFIISYVNDYLARCIQNNFTGLSLQPGDMAVKFGLILRKEKGRRERQSSEKIGYERGDAEEKYLNGILQKHLLSKENMRVEEKQLCALKPGILRMKTQAVNNKNNKPAEFLIKGP